MLSENQGELVRELSDYEMEKIQGGSSAACWAAGALFVGSVMTGQFEGAFFSGWYISNYC